jgi:hypothetical protein
MAAAAAAKRLEWSRRALDAYLPTLARIAEEDPFTAQQFEIRGQTPKPADASWNRFGV